MIARIVVGSGNARTAIAMPRDKDTKRSLSGKIKGFLFPSNGTYRAAKARGERSMVAA
jgi:hypothetical protein